MVFTSQNTSLFGSISGSILDSDLGSFFIMFWTHLGSLLAPFRSFRVSFSSLFRDRFLIDFWITFWMVLAPKTEPNEEDTLLFFWCPGATWRPLGSPRHPRSHLYRYFIDLGSIFGRPGPHFVDFASFWERFCSNFVDFLHGFSTCICRSPKPPSTKRNAKNLPGSAKNLTKHKPSATTCRT